MSENFNSSLEIQNLECINVQACLGQYGLGTSLAHLGLLRRAVGDAEQGGYLAYREDIKEPERSI
jgi:hypothetical protein